MLQPQIFLYSHPEDSRDIVFWLSDTPLPLNNSSTQWGHWKRGLWTICSMAYVKQCFFIAIIWNVKFNDLLWSWIYFVSSQNCHKHCKAWFPDFVVLIFQILVTSAQTLYQRLHMTEMSYPDLAEASFEVGPFPKLRKYSKWFRCLYDTYYFSFQIWPQVVRW